METPGVFVWLLVMFNINVKASLISTKMDLCGPIMQLVLDKSDESSATIALVSHEYTTLCKLKVTAPKTHVIHLNIIEAQYQREVISRTDSCHLNVYQEGNTKPVWSGDPCSNEVLSDIDLLNPEVTLEWSPPVHPIYTKGRKLLVTAVGRGDICKDNLQHTCMTIGHEPLFCVSKYLICDGNRNCPKGATKNDEDDNMCENTFFMLFKHIKNTEMNDKILNLISSKATKSPKNHLDWRDWTHLQRIEDTTTPMPTTTEHNQTSNIESLSAALSHYGPWGYILLGMLICGTVLMFCGVWECFKKPKSTPDTTLASPTTVVIINQQEENNPPRYEDIDPPSYSTLFPNVKATNDSLQTTESTTTESTTSEVENQREEASANFAESRSDIRITSDSTTLRNGASGRGVESDITNTNLATTSRDISHNTVSVV